MKEKRGIKYYLNDLKSMSKVKKILLAVMVLIIVGSGFKCTMTVYDNGVDNPTYGIKRSIDF